MSHSQLTERDRKLAEAGMPPIDLAEPRLLSELERARLSLQTKAKIRELQHLGYVPIVVHGSLGFRSASEI